MLFIISEILVLFIMYEGAKQTDMLHALQTMYVNICG